MKQTFETTLSPDVADLRRAAREHTEDGAVTRSNKGDREAVIAMLNGALATELVCVLRYRRHHFMAKGLSAKAVAAEFLVHSAQELGHADELAARVVQLNGAPDFEPTGLSARAHAQYVEGGTLVDMIRENLIAERIAIDAYRGMLTALADDDSTTRRMLEGILAVEEQHAEELADLLVSQGPETQPVMAAPKPHATPPAKTQAKTVATRQTRGGNGHPARETRP
jgi:bacterioferritin